MIILEANIGCTDLFGDLEELGIISGSKFKYGEFFDSNISFNQSFGMPCSKVYFYYFSNLKIGIVGMELYGESSLNRPEVGPEYIHYSAFVEEDLSIAIKIMRRKLLSKENTIEGIVYTNVDIIRRSIQIGPNPILYLELIPS